jgi:hypothetical protein
MDRNKKLITAGAISATATAGLITVAAGLGVFGLSDSQPRVGNLRPIDSTRTTSSTLPDDVQTIVVDDAPTTTGVPSTPGATVGTRPSTAPGASPTTTVTAPRGAEPGDDRGDDRFEPGDDHGGDRVESDDDSSGPGSHDDGVDNSGPGSEHSGRDHAEDD